MSQNNLAEPTSGTLSGLSLVQGLNAALDTLNTLASGASAPATPEVGQLWHDTGNNLLKIRSQDNTAWETVGSFDETNHLFTAALAASAASAAVASSLSATLGIGAGGTGATSPAAALTNLLGSSIIGQGSGGTGVSSLASLFNDSYGADGYRHNAMDGFMVQWLTTSSIAANSGSTIYFPSSFANTCLAAVASRYSTSVTAGGANAYGWTANFLFVYNASPVASNITVLAIGY